VRRASLLVLLLAGGPAAELHSQVERPTWSISLLGGLASFRGAGLDTLEAERANARPGGAAGFGLGVARRWGAWETALEASSLPSHLEVATSEVLVREQVASLTRFRIQAILGRRLATVGASDVVIGGGPTMDRWSYGGDAARTVWGGEARLTLRHRLGRVSLENVVAYGVSSGPFHADELPPGYERRSLRTLTLGGSLVYGF
jgi:hypothetical protein